MAGLHETAELARVIAQATWEREREEELHKSDFLTEDAIPTWDDLGEPAQHSRTHEARSIARAILAAGYLPPAVAPAVEQPPGTRPSNPAAADMDAGPAPVAGSDLVEPPQPVEPTDGAEPGIVEQPWMDAARSALWTYDRYRNAATPLDAAHALVELDDEVGSLATWLPEYDYGLGWLVDQQDAG